MLGYLQDKWQSALLKARYQRLIQERLLQLTESAGPQPVADDPGRWTLLGVGARGFDENARTDARTKARRMVQCNPHARNLLRLLEVYVAGPGLHLVHEQRDFSMSTDDVERELKNADRLWTDFLLWNERHYSFQEHARRTWRDGECFLRKFSETSWPPDLRFVDPETIGPTKEDADSQGIVTDADDVESPQWYLRIDPTTGDLIETIAACEMLHTRVGVDSNEKRGVTVLNPVIEQLERFESWIGTELAARKLQASIVLWRKVTNPAAATAFSGESTVESMSGISPGPGVSRFQPGSVLTTGASTDIRFVQPDTNYSDTVPLGRMLLLNAAAGAGLPEFMLTSDASNANYASTMVAEGPAVKMFQSEQHFYKREFSRLWRWVMSNAIRAGELREDFFKLIQPKWCFPELVNRDRPRERLADVRLVDACVLSRAEIARRDGVDPDLMRRELDREGKDASLRALACERQLPRMKAGQDELMFEHASQGAEADPDRNAQGGGSHASVMADL
ncbi:MAG: phage portal protein [Planctomycetaceae bacterium]|nr:phage portal protein [Planctomycetaceae bacterium]